MGGRGGERNRGEACLGPSVESRGREEGRRE